MKKFILKTVALASLFVASLVTLSACVPVSVWWDEPGPGWDSFQDYRLYGYWQLVQYNSDPVSPSMTNFLYFDGRGAGYYYYYDRGYREREQLRYWCQENYGTTSNYEINIQYQYSSPVTTTYWFTHGDNTLWMQWRTTGGRMETYVYDRINRAPW